MFLYYSVINTVYLIKSDRCVSIVRQMAAFCQRFVRCVGAMMDRVTIRLPRQQVEMLEKLVEVGEFPTVSEAVRHAVRMLLEKQGNRVLHDIDQVSFNV
jgi:antitoxin ParD1/3/4